MILRNQNSDEFDNTKDEYESCVVWPVLTQPHLHIVTQNTVLQLSIAELVIAHSIPESASSNDSHVVH